METNRSDETLANCLGWFSVGLGLAELMAPNKVARMIGVDPENGATKVLRCYGMREIAAGVGILSKPRPADWVWGRVAGDVMDLATLATAMTARNSEKGKLAAATAAVLGVTAVDVVCAQMLSSRPHAHDADPANVHTHNVSTITINRSPEEVSRAWQEFRQEMRIRDSMPIHFDRAPGDRGTLVRVEGSSMRIDSKLRAFKQKVETGEIVHSDASIHPGMHAAQPPEYSYAM